MYYQFVLGTICIEMEGQIWRDVCIFGKLWGRVENSALFKVSSAGFIRRHSINTFSLIFVSSTKFQETF